MTWEQTTSWCNINRSTLWMVSLIINIKYISSENIYQDSQIIDQDKASEKISWYLPIFSSDDHYLYSINVPTVRGKM